MAAFGRGLMYYMLMCTDVSAILWILSDILTFVLFSKEQREELEKKDTEEMHNDSNYNLLMSMFGFTSDNQMAIFLLILGTYVPGLNVIFWKGILLGPFEKRKKL